MDSLSGLLQPAFRSSKSLNELLPGAPFQPSSAQKSTSEQAAAQSAEVVQDAVLGRISGGSGAVLETSDADFSPQAVADRITGFVETAIQQRGGSGIEAQSLLRQAKEGIEQGIREARETLESLGQLSGEVERQVNETESLIFKGLERLEQSLTPTPALEPALEPALGGGSTVVAESGLFSSQFKQTSEAAIEIVTRDGDRVEISYSAFTQSATSQRFSSNASAFSFSSRQQASSSVAFQFSVEGSLDAQERDSINNLLNDIGEIAGQFFQGDVQAAFNASLELGFDSETLKGFSLDFQQTTRVQVAEAYQRTEQVAGPIESVLEPATVNPRPAVDVLAQLENLIAQAKENELIKEPESTLKSLLADMLDLLNEKFDSPVQAYIKEIIRG
ncbi:hypothetical protein MNBD_GAMMA11-1830 [hydrothermal vent metagenome]|uniref:DUF5610 domain-containing protein n=1 Tax=hydrothermal vent metagenome TaxID=652676 RepID=A0A3B0WUE9_9ZZZZ